MDDTARFYGVSLILALLVHALVVAMLWFNWTPAQRESLLVRPNIVKAELVVMEAPQPKATPKPAPSAPQQDVVKPKPPEPKPEPKPPPKPEPKVEPKPKPAEVKPDPKEAAKRAQVEKQKKLDSLANSSFSDALARETEVLNEDKQEQAAQTYAQGIYQLIVTNWSRPPSARNGMQTKLMVELVPTGAVVNVTIVQSSGNEAFDRSAEQAVRKVGKFDVPKEPDLFEKYFRRFPVLFKPEDLIR